MISLDLMKSSEVRTAGDPSNNLKIIMINHEWEWKHEKMIIARI